ncbi:unnamed protein product, partial [Meganyctiphanes norvegica]
TNQILCGGRQGVDACEGDSGGPMTFQNSVGLQTVVGVIASGFMCPIEPRFPGFYSNIANYIDWIYATTGLGRSTTIDFSDGNAWLDARADGFNYVWQHDKMIVRPGSPLWWPGWPDNYVTSDRCLLLLSDNNHWSQNPGRHYGSNLCTFSRRTLCEGCPEGFFMSAGSKQCFKFFNDVKRTWLEARTKCSEEGLIIAKPSEAVSVALRKDLFDRY